MDKYRWNNPFIILALFFGIGLIALFIFIESRTSYPMMDLTMFSNKLFSMGNLSALLNFMAQFTVTLLMPFYLQQLRLMTPARAGLLMIPMPLTTLIVAPVSGILSDRIDTRYISSAGMGIAAAGIWQLSNLHVESPDIAIILALITVGLGVGMFQTPNNSAVMGAVSANRRGIASSTLATMRNIGMVLGIAVSGAVFSTHYTQLNTSLAAKGVTGGDLNVQSFTGALHLSYSVGVVFAIIAVFTSLIRGKIKPQSIGT